MSGSGTLLREGGGSHHDEEPLRLVQVAPDGDAGTFTLLYDLFEQRLFNFCHRLLGSAEDAADATQEAFLAVLTGPDKHDGRDSNLRVYLFAAAHDACHDIMAARSRTGTSNGRHDPGEIYVDPERASRLSSLQNDVRAANGALFQREREVLALRELEFFGYPEIAEITRLARGEVAELISSARLRLRDELRASTVSEAAAAAPDCRRALPLLSMAQDTQARDEQDREWLADHLHACQTCRASREAMQEAGICYRAWLRIVPLHWLREATLAKATEPGDSHVSEVSRPLEHAEVAGREQAGTDAAGYDRRRFTLGAVSTLVFLLGVCAVMVIASTGSKRTAATSKPRDAAIPSTSAAPARAKPSTSQGRGVRRRVPPVRPATQDTRRTLATPLTGVSPRATRRAPKPVRRAPVRRTPVRRGTEGGPPVPRPTAPPVRSHPTPSAPTTMPPPGPSGGTTAPPGGGCANTSGAPVPC